MKLRSLSIIIVTLLLISTLLLPMVSASRWGLEAQLRYYLKRVFGLSIPRDAEFRFKPLAPLCDFSTDVLVNLWSCSKRYNVTISTRNLELNLSIEVGPGNKVIAISILGGSALRTLNWSRVYVVDYSYDPSSCRLVILNASNLLAKLLKVVESVLESKGVKEYLGELAQRLCARGCSYLIENVSEISIDVCPGETTGSAIYLANGYCIDYEARASRITNNISRLDFWLSIEVPWYGWYQVVEVGLARVKGDRFVIASAAWKPYRVEVVKPSKKLVKELAKLALDYVNSSLRSLVPRNVDSSTCRLSVAGVFEHGIPREIPVNSTTLVL